MKSIAGTIILLASTMLSAGEYPESGGGIFNRTGTLSVVNTGLHERIIVNYHLDTRPGSDRDANTSGLNGDVLITYVLRVFGANGDLLAEFTDEAPVDGFGQTTLALSDPTSFDALLAINDTGLKRIPVSNDRFAVRIDGSTARTGINPATGETIQIPARRTIGWTITIVGASGETRSVSRVREIVPDGFTQTFPAPLP